MNDRLQNRWDTLPAVARTPGQLAGRGGVACGSTHGIMERCNLACTSCYLTSIANETSPLPFAQVRAQLQTLRSELGPGAKVQITSGEVTMLPVAELGAIIECALELGLDPMLMTNGVRLLRERSYLLDLVQVHGLRKISIHVDVTQRGRPEVGPHTHEQDLLALRARFAELIRWVRHASGIRLLAAQTVTVTPRNLEEVRDIARWSFEHADVFRLLSFLPVAEVGRTEDHGDTVGIESVWSRVRQAAARALDRDAMHFGHRDCNLTAPLLVLKTGNETEVIDFVRERDETDRAAFAQGLALLAARVDWNRGVLRNAGCIASVLARHPVALAHIGWALLRRGISEWRLFLRALGSLARGKKVRLDPLFLVVHAFMNAEELETPAGRERLEACVFKLPVEGRLVSMCEFNATQMRLDQNRQQLATLRRATSAEPLSQTH